MAKNVERHQSTWKTLSSQRIGNKWQIFFFTKTLAPPGGWATIRRYGDRRTPPTIKPQYLKKKKFYACDSRTPKTKMIKLLF